MENVQHKFFRLDVKSSEYQMPFDSHNYDNVLNSLNLPTLSRRTIMSDIIFISEIAISEIILSTIRISCCYSSSMYQC